VNRAGVVMLQTTEDGRRLYEALGVRPIDEYRLVID
jgi:hypothetical protein